MHGYTWPTYVELEKRALTMLKKARKRLGRLVFDAADTDDSGRIDRDEFEDYINADPRLLRWLEASGTFWVSLHTTCHPCLINHA